jgi:hypothetical protein
MQTPYLAATAEPKLQSSLVVTHLDDLIGASPKDRVVFVMVHLRPWPLSGGQMIAESNACFSGIRT